MLFNNQISNKLLEYAEKKKKNHNLLIQDLELSFFY